ncbi:MAG: hypothetical protein M3Z10_02115 [Gemmatimonadota bacterium]|nr:hypothetical protein [Gemmatimonadota bacterium]
MPDSAISAFFRSSSADRPPLRIGILLDDVRLSRALASVVEDIQASNFARVELLVFNAGELSAPAQPARTPSLASRVFGILTDAHRRRSLAWSLYTRLDRRHAQPMNDPLESVDCSAMLDGIDRIHVHPVTKRFEHRFPETALAHIRSARLDVLLRFGFNILRGGILDAARYGVWSFHHGDNDRYRGGPAHFWELAEDNPLSGVVLQRLTEDLDAGIILAKSLFATERGLSLARNRVRPYFGSTHLVIQKLRELHERGWDYVEEHCVPSAPYEGRRRIYKRPTNGELLRWALPRVLGKAIARSARSFTAREEVEHWRIAIRTGYRALEEGSHDMSGFRWIESPRGHYYADPFLLERDGRIWIFFEDFLYSSGRGVISCAAIDSDGTMGPCQVALETAGHLSYPYVFREGEAEYMIPESAADGVVRLYRATAFPLGWKLHAELYWGTAVDTSVCKHDGAWWFFTTLPEPRGQGALLALFRADSLTGRWVAHPLSPISADVRRARGAGSIFRSGHSLIRPSQDGSRTYGYSFTLNRIVTLSPTEYDEQAIATVGPDWDPELLGTHSYNRVGAIEVTDGKVRRRRRDVV